MRTLTALFAAVVVGLAMASTTGCKLEWTSSGTVVITPQRTYPDQGVPYQTHNPYPQETYNPCPPEPTVICVPRPLIVQHPQPPIREMWSDHAKRRRFLRDSIFGPKNH